MKIYITTAKGVGKTQLSSFDNALVNAGIANFNLIPLSSVIPPESEIVTGRSINITGGWGDRLYVVMSVAYSNGGDKSWAGLGWVQDSEMKGLFVEHVAKSEDELSEKIHKTLNDMITERPECDFGNINIIATNTPQSEKISCALAIAVYKSEAWGKIENNSEE